MLAASAVACVGPVRAVGGRSLRQFRHRNAGRPGRLGDLLPKLGPQRRVGRHLRQQGLEAVDRLARLARLHGGDGQVVAGDAAAGIGLAAPAGTPPRRPGSRCRRPASPASRHGRRRHRGRSGPGRWRGGRHPRPGPTGSACDRLRAYSSQPAASDGFCFSFAASAAVACCSDGRTVGLGDLRLAGGERLVRQAGRTKPQVAADRTAGDDDEDDSRQDRAARQPRRRGRQPSAASRRRWISSRAASASAGVIRPRAMSRSSSCNWSR